MEATWDEFDLDAGLWTVPAARMKAGKEHRVPLSKPALAIVKALHEVRISDYVFPGHAKGRPLSNMAFAMLLERMKADQYTPHGFRSAFRDWAGDGPLSRATWLSRHWRTGLAMRRNGPTGAPTRSRSGASSCSLGGLLPRRRKDGNVMPLRA